MAAFCKHSTFLSAGFDVQYHHCGVQSPKCELPFRPGTKVSLVVTNVLNVPSEKDVKIAIEGSAMGLKGEIWAGNSIGNEHFFCANAEFNTNYRLSLGYSDRVFCKVWLDECPFCKAGAKQKEAHEKKLQTLCSQLNQLEDRFSEQRLQAENTLKSRIQQLEQEAADNERKLAAAGNENAVLASTIQSLELKLGERTEEAKSLIEQRFVLAGKVNDLKSALASEQTHSSSLQRQIEDLEKARKSKEDAVELERELAAVQRENAAFVERKKQLDAGIAGLKRALEENAGMADEMADVHEKLASAEKANAASNAKNKELNAKISELTAALEKTAEAAEELAAVNEKLARVENEKAACMEQNEQLAAALEAQQTASEAAAAEKLAAEGEKAALLSKVARLESKLDEWKNEATAAANREKELIEQRSVLEDHMKELQSTISNDRIQTFLLLQGLQRQIDELKSVRGLEEAAIKRAAVSQEELAANPTAALEQQTGEAAAAGTATSNLGDLEQRTDDGDSQLPPALQSAEDSADDQSESSASSGWEAVDAK
ncbi:hypothetical protein M3Y99_01569400 [Aphelenchoides fujianensis]|nr:hypothetical protein M3Y99_01569400 [Aphelenchoides fujianensis]